MVGAGARAGPEGHRRPRPQPHQRRARVVPGGAGRRARQPRARALHLPRRHGASTASCRRTTGTRSSAAPAGPASPRPTAPPASGTCTSSTSSSPTSTGTTPRSATSSSRSCGSGSTGASTASGSTWPTAWSRRQGLPDYDVELHILDGERQARLAPSPPMWDQDGVHDDLPPLAQGPRRRTAQPDRILCAEAWVRPQERAVALRPPRRDAPGVQLRLPQGASGRAETCARSSSPRCAAADSVGAPSTWVLSNHDVVRHASRLGLPGRRAPAQRHQRRRPAARPRARAAAGPRRHDADAGAARWRRTSTRARSSACRTRPTCPASSARTRRSSAPHGEEIGRDGCRVPIPWEKDAPSFGFGPVRPDLAAAAGGLRRVRRRPAGRRRGLDPRALPHAARRPPRALGSAPAACQASTASATTSSRWSTPARRRATPWCSPTSAPSRWRCPTGRPSWSRPGR